MANSTKELSKYETETWKTNKDLLRTLTNAGLNWRFYGFIKLKMYYTLERCGANIRGN